MADEDPIVPVPEEQQVVTEPSLQTRLENIFGLLIRVTATPTWIPRAFHEGFAIDTTNSRYYWYDFVSASWKFSQGGTSVTNILNGLLPDQTGNSGEFLTTNGTNPSWADVTVGDLRGTFTFGEAITDRNAVIIGDGTTYNQITQSTSDTTPDISISSNQLCGQTFTTPAGGMSLSSIKLYSIVRLAGGSMTNHFDIYATSGGFPTGSSLGSSEESGSNPGGPVTLTFSPPLNLAGSTVYAFVIVSNQNYEVNNKNTTNPYSGGQAIYSSNNGSTWGTLSDLDAGLTNCDLAFDINGVFVENYIYQADASSNDIRANNFFGIALETGAAFASGLVAYNGYITGMSGLTPGRQYLSDTAGALSASAGSQSRKVGIAPTATTFFIKHDNS